MKNGLIIFFLTGISSAFGQVDSAIYNKLVAHVHFLASDSLKGRAPGSPAEKVANAYVESHFLVNRRAKNQTWNFTVSGKDSTLNCHMVGSFISNKSPFTVLIGAHIDHIGMGGVLSKSPGKTAVHNGADDNASGVALLIELQRYFARKKVPFNLLLVAYTAHEIGTYGSEYLAGHLDKKYGTLAGVLNFDMVGRMDDKNRLYISCNAPADSLFDTTAFVQPVYQDQKKLELLDTKHFLDRKIPCATFSTGMHADYHKITDDAAYIHYEGLYHILRYLENWLENPVREKDFSAPKAVH